MKIKIGLFIWAMIALALLSHPNIQAKNLNQREVDLSLPFYVGSKQIGELAVRILKNGDVYVEQAGLARLAIPLLRPIGANLLRTVPSERAYQSLSLLRQAGLNILYDPLSNQIVLTPTVEQAAFTNLSLGNRQAISQPTPTNGVSGFVNFYNSVDIDYENRDDSDNGVYRTLMDGAVHYGGFTMEGEASWDDRYDGMRRSGTRLVFDDVTNVMRAQGGDVVSQTAGFQISENILGISLDSSFNDFNLSAAARPTGSQSFRLDRPSKVDITVNGAFVRRLNLQPGDYNLQNLGFSSQGANNVRVLIEDDAGRQKVIDFTVFSENSLLAPGLTEFGITGGVRSHLENDERLYNSGDTVFSGFVRHGLSERITLGLNSQVDDNSGLFGSEVVLATPIGAFAMDLGYSKQWHGNSGYGLDIDYNLSRFKLYAGDTSNRNLSISWGHRSDEFTNLGVKNQERVHQLAAGAYSQDLSSHYRVSLSGNWELSDEKYSSNLTATLSRSWTNRIRVAASLGHSNGYADFEGVYGLLSVTYDLDTKNRISAAYDTRHDQSQLNYTKMTPDEIGGFGYDIQAIRYGEVNSESVDGSARYNANRAELMVDHRLDTAAGKNDIQTNRTTLHANTALAFAGGHVTLSRPIHRSGFAIIAPHTSIADKQLVVDKNYNSSPRYQSDFLGPAVVYDIIPYQKRNLSIDVADLPIGYNLGSGDFTVTPYYKAGYAFTVGSDYFVTLIATATDQNGAPAAFLTGTALEEIAASSNGPVQIFTNQKGRLVAQGLRPGRWIITLNADNSRLRYIVDIPKGTTNVVKMGTISPTKN